jgi:hypothetical protein
VSDRIVQVLVADAECPGQRERGRDVADLLRGMTVRP